ncbi:MAG: galactose ABC transporter substrate-binding protein [Erysipelotrichaceae bacterium]|nr:galactose ABC transporter substrate-binding protein [Erysipelotrichaceae bacterium]MBR5048155.1 galactose ABC transporter substrate-binding protein [Erysipelotrichaceae bacterium]
MKKLLAVLLALLMVVSFAGCEKKPQVKEVKIGVAIYQFNDNFMTLYRNDIQKYFEDLNAKDASVHYTVEIVDGANDVNTQTEQVRTFISKGVDALIVNLVQTTSDALAKEVVASGIPCVFINREIADFAYGDKTCYVGADARDSGRYQGEIIYNVENHGDLNNDGVVSYIMIMGDPENTDAQYRTEFSIKKMEELGAKVECLFQQTGNWDQAQGQELVANALSTFGDKIEVVFCNNDGMALGAYQSIVAAGRTVGKDIYLVGVDALPECCQMVKDGTMTGTVLNDDLGQATAACETVLGLLAGKAPEKKVNYVPYVMVTTENVDNYLK